MGRGPADCNMLDSNTDILLYIDAAALAGPLDTYTIKKVRYRDGQKKSI